MKYSQLADSRIRGQIIRAYRETYDENRLLTQEDLAGHLGKDARTLRGWESGKPLSIRPENARALHQKIGIPLQLLGLEDRVEPEEAEHLHKRIIALLEHGSYISALETSNLLIKEYQMAGKRGLKMKSFILPSAYHTLGLATATLKDDPNQAEEAFKHMRRTLKESKESNYTYISALGETHLGDMKRRQGKYANAQRNLENVLDKLPDEQYSGTNALIVGNCLQLLARVHLAQLKQEGQEEHKKKTFYYLRKAEELAQVDVPEEASNYYNCFGLLSVKAELVKGLMLTLQYDEAFEELEKMKEMAKNASPRWRVLTYIKEGELQMRYGRSYEDTLMIKKAELSLQQGYKQAGKFLHLRQQQNVRRLIGKWESNDLASQEGLQTLRENLDHIDEENNKL